jgi:hypothetical protein
MESGNGVLTLKGVSLVAIVVADLEDTGLTTDARFFVGEPPFKSNLSIGVVIFARRHRISIGEIVAEGLGSCVGFKFVVGISNGAALQTTDSRLIVGCPKLGPVFFVIGTTVEYMLAVEESDEKC